MIKFNIALNILQKFRNRKKEFEILKYKINKQFDNLQSQKGKTKNFSDN